MLAQASLLAIVTSAIFSGLALMSDRPRGALIAQAGLALAGALMMVAIVRDSAFGIGAPALAAFAVAVMAACVAGMLYHLYLGRFTRVWAARAVFTLVFFGTSALFGFVFLSLI